MIWIHFGDVSRFELPCLLSLSQPNVPQSEFSVGKIIVSITDMHTPQARVKKRLLAEESGMTLEQPFGDGLHLIDELLLNLLLIPRFQRSLLTRPFRG